MEGREAGKGKRKERESRLGRGSEVNERKDGKKESTKLEGEWKGGKQGWGREYVKGRVTRRE